MSLKLARSVQAEGDTIGQTETTGDDIDSGEERNMHASPRMGWTQEIASKNQKHVLNLIYIYMPSQLQV